MFIYQVANSRIDNELCTSEARRMGTDKFSSIDRVTKPCSKRNGIRLSVNSPNTSSFLDVTTNIETVGFTTRSPDVPRGDDTPFSSNDRAHRCTITCSSARRDNGHSHQVFVAIWSIHSNCLSAANTCMDETCITSLVALTPIWSATHIPSRAARYTSSLKCLKKSQDRM